MAISAIAAVTHVEPFDLAVGTLADRSHSAEQDRSNTP